MSRRPHAVLVTGAPGVGKSEVSRRLTHRMSGEVALIDLDSLAAIDPWRADERRFDLMACNAAHVLREYLAWGVIDFVVAGVMLPGMVYDRIVGVLEHQRVTHRCYGLRARAEVLTARINEDLRFRDRESRLADRVLDALVDDIADAVQLDTSELTADEVAARILDIELSTSGERGALVDIVGPRQRCGLDSTPRPRKVTG